MTDRTEETVAFFLPRVPGVDPGQVVTVRYVGWTRPVALPGGSTHHRVLEAYRVIGVSELGMDLELDTEPTGPNSGLTVTIQLDSPSERSRDDRAWIADHPDPMFWDGPLNHLAGMGTREQAEAVAAEALRIHQEGQPCGAVFAGRTDRDPCRKPLGHEHGAETDWKRHYHSNGLLKWRVDGADVPAPSDWATRPEPETVYRVEGMAFGAPWHNEAETLAGALRLVADGTEHGRYSAEVIVMPDGRRIEGKKLDDARTAFELGRDGWQRLEG